MRILAPPGVFAPRSDSWILARAVAREVRTGASVLDLCTGSGAVAVSAARGGAARAVAVDASRRAVLAARINARLNGVTVEGRHGDLFGAVDGERFDLITSNPPYLPTEDPAGANRGLAWDAGPDGRELLDRICAEAPAHLRPGGVVLLIQSSVTGEQHTLDALAAAGLTAAVTERHRGPLGPLLAARAGELERRGLLDAGCREEDLLVIRGQARG